jgi:hypothetical protein
MPRRPGVLGPSAARDASDVSTTPSHLAQAGLVAAAVVTDTTTSRERISRQQASLRPRPRREPVMERRAVFVALALLAAVLGAAAVSRSISDVLDTRTQVAEARALNDGIRAQVEAGRREVGFAQSDAYLRFAARGLGYGRGREQAFALREGAPPPPSITPLGANAVSAPSDVLSSLVDLLFEP